VRRVVNHKAQEKMAGLGSTRQEVGRFGVGKETKEDKGGSRLRKTNRKRLIQRHID